MSNLITTNEGELELLDKMMKDALDTDESYILRLFNNDHTPAAASTSTDFTACTFTGYTDMTLPRASWGSATTVSNKASATYGTAQSWTCGSTGDSCYGYVVLGATSNKALWAQRWDSVINLTSNDQLSFTPVFTLNSEN